METGKITFTGFDLLVPLIIQTDNQPALSPIQSVKRVVFQEIKALAKGLMGEFFLFSGSTVLAQASRMAVFLLVARWLGPEQFGVWNALSLILMYSPLVSLGVPNGMNREVPKLQGQGHFDEANKIANLTFWFLLLVYGASTLIIAVAALISDLSPQSRTPLLWMAILLFAAQLYNYFQMLLKCHIRFRAMSLQQIVSALVTPLVVIPLTYYWQLNGFILGQAVVALGLCLLIRQISPLRVGFPLQLRGFLSLARIGLPIMGAGFLYFLLTTIDRWVILKYLGIESLGQYTVAIMTFGGMGLLPRVVSEQMYPRIAFHFGQTGDKRMLLPLIFRQSFMAGAVTLPVVVPVIFLLPVLVKTFLPAYAGGIASAQILLIGVVFLPLAGGTGNFLNTVDKQLYYFAVQAVMVVVNVSLGIIFVKMGLALNGVALAGTITYIIYVLLLSFICYLVLQAK